MESNCDLRPILSMILLGMQDYQSERTKVDALKCINFLSNIDKGNFRAKIWHWVKYTSISQNKVGGEPFEISKIARKTTQAYIHGFIHTICELMS